MNDENVKNAIRNIINNGDSITDNEKEYLYTIIFEIINKLVDFPNEIDTTIAELIKYNPDIEFIEPMKQGQIFRLLEQVCNRLNIRFVNTNDSRGGLAFYYTFKKGDKLSDKISKFFANKTYEDKLLIKYGKANKYEKHNLKLLFIADTHNCLKDGNETLKFIQEQKYYDYCILLGDHSGSDIEEILKVVPIDKICGVLGNHDSWDLYKQYGIKNIDGKIYNLGNVRIAGIGGSCKYKNTSEYVQYTQEQSIAIADTLSGDIHHKPQILISHDKAFTEDNNNVTHDGLKGITKYIYENHIGLHIHGHIHEESEQILKNGTRSVCVYMAKIIEL